MKSHRIIAIAAMVTVPLCVAFVRAADTAINPGETLTYERSIQGQRTSADHMKMLVKVESGNAAAYQAQITYFPTGKAPIVHEMRRDDNGWTALDGSDKPYDFVDIDPALFCTLPQSFTVGDHWSCVTAPLWHIWPASKVVVTVTKANADLVELTATGIGNAETKTYIDDDTGKPVATQMQIIWKTSATFKNAMLQSETSRITENIRIGNQTIPNVMTVRIERT